MPFDLLLDDAVFLVRWLHVIAAIAWVGSAFALARLDLAMRPRGTGAGPQSLLLHAGAAFRFSPTPEADASEQPVHFKWEAYAAWVSGFALICMVFFAQPRLYLIDPRQWDAAPWAAIAVVVVLLPGVWLAYDALCKKSGLTGDAALAGLFLFAGALAVLVVALFAGRAAFPLIGAYLATLMAGNIAHAIVPAQRRRLLAMRAGQAPDEAEAKAAGQRALHNQYLALPVIFFMLSGHAPLLFAGPHRSAVAVLAIGAGFVIRRFFLKRSRGLGPDWSLAAAAAVLLALLLALAWPNIPREQAARDGGQAIARIVHPGPDAARRLIEQKCAWCHEAAPIWPGLAQAPDGLDFTDPHGAEKNAAAILRAAVLSPAMPPPGAAAPLDDEDRLLLWRALH
jgi:uncharacterized membrane protein